MFTKEEIVTAALDLTRERGFGAVSARSLGDKLGSSSRPIFSYFKSMDDVKSAIEESANEIYNSYIEEEMNSGKYPAYKANCMAYIRFAREEKELFKLLFLSDSSAYEDGEAENGTGGESETEIAPLVSILQKQLGFSKEDAQLFFSETWVTVHGIAAMTATNDLNWTESFVSKTLNDVFAGLKYSLENK